jgi:hypothetical protein
MSTASAKWENTTASRRWLWGRLPGHGGRSADTLLIEDVMPLIRNTKALGAQHWELHAGLRGRSAVTLIRVLGSVGLMQLLEDVGCEDTSYQVVPPYRSQGDQHCGTTVDSLSIDVDEVSSDFALWAANRIPDRLARAALETLLLHDGVRTLREGPGAPTDPRRAFCSWQDFWILQRAGHDIDVDNSPCSLDAMGSEIAQLRDDPTVSTWRFHWRCVLDQSLKQARERDVPHTPQHLTLAHSSRMLNRLGLTHTEVITLGVQPNSSPTI